MSAAGPRPIERLAATMALTLAMGLAAALLSVRLAAENGAVTVEIAYPESRLLAATASAPDAPATALRAGITALVREPYTLEDMLRYGLAEAWRPQPDRLQIGLADHTLAGHALMYLSAQLGQARIGVRLREGKFLAEVRLPEPQAALDGSRYILEVPYGPMPAGFRRGLRLPAGDWDGGGDLDQFTQALASLKPDFVMPDWRGGRGASAFYRAYRRTPWLRRPLLVLPETGLPPAGRAVLRGQPPRDLTRACLTAADDFASGERRLRMNLVRAVRERGVRLLYLRFPHDWSFDREMTFVGELRRALAASGIRAGAASLAARVRPGAWVMGAIFLGLGAAVFLFVWRMALWGVGVTGQDPAADRVLTIRLKPSWFRWTGLLTALALLVFYFEGPAGWGLQAAAWLAAFVAPLLGLSEASADPAAEAPSAAWVRESLKDFGRVSAWTLGGGVAIAALFYQPDFITRLSGFAGSGPAFVLPLFAATLYLFPRITDRSWWSDRFSPGRRAATAAGLAAVLAVAAGLAWRAGWLPGLPAWVAAADLRDRLAVWLGAEPTVLECLFGHPLLLLGLAGRRLIAARGRVWPDLCLLGGFTGQLSMIHAFAQAHTPLALTLARTAWGLGLGLALGLALLAAAAGLARRAAGQAGRRA